jgi:polyhydroxybutyrate depolymerase
MTLQARILFTLAVVMCLLVCFAAPPANAQVMKWTIDGVSREALIIPPSKANASGKAPAIFAFHGHGGNMHETAAGMRFENFWPQAIVVYLQGLPTNPSADPQGYGWIYNTGHDGDRDVKFFDAVLATLREKFPVDNRRIYATGFSNGGMFTYVLWGTRASVFAAFAAVAGRIVPAVHLTEPKPILHVAGEQDTTVPFKDQLQAIKIARELDGTNKEGTPCGQNCTTYRSTKGTPVVTYIHTGGHVYPPGTSEMIVKFFEGQSLGE